jgi:hypothetical protein
VEALVPLLIDQDHDVRFRKAAGASSQLVESVWRPVAAAGAANQASTASTQAIMEADIRPLHIIVFIANNTVTLKAVQTALYLARWGGWGV